MPPFGPNKTQDGAVFWPIKSLNRAVLKTIVPMLSESPNTIKPT